jgi:hypothetical protein
MSTFITVPTVWETFECQDNVLSVIGAQVGLPPHIVLEMMVMNGIAKKVNRVTTTRASIVEPDGIDPVDPEDSPWITE